MELLNTTEFINKWHCKEVSTSKMLDTKTNNPVPGGLYDPSIFGTGDKIYTQFGYINTHQKFLHPFVYKNMGKINTVLNRILKRSKKGIVENGIVKELPIESSSGDTGVDFFLKHFKDIKLEVYLKDNKNDTFVEYIIKNRNLCIQDKILVIPTGFRPYSIEKNQIKADQINDLYILLIKSKEEHASFSKNTNIQELLNDLSDSNNLEYIQGIINGIYDYIMDKMDKKFGLIKGKSLSKRMNNVARLVANADINIPLGSVGIPWSTLLVLFDVFVMRTLKKYPELKVELGYKETDIIDPDEFSELLNFINRSTSLYVNANPGKKETFLKILKTIFNDFPDLMVIVSRDPTWDAGSFHALYPIIGVKDTSVLSMPPQTYVPLGGDSFRSNKVVLSKYVNDLDKQPKLSENFYLPKNSFYKLITSTDEILNGVGI